MVDRELCEKMKALYLFFFLFEKTSPGYYLPFVKSFYVFFFFFSQCFSKYLVITFSFWYSLSLFLSGWSPF